MFSGIERDSLSLESVINLFKGESLTNNVKTRFYKSFYKLNIIIKNNLKITIKQTSSKKVINGKYVSHHVGNSAILNLLNIKLIKLKNKLSKYIKKYFNKNIS